MPSSIDTADLRVAYAPASPDIAHESFDGEVVVVDLVNGKYYSFSDSGSAIWLALSEAATPSDLAGLCPFGDAVPAFVQQLCDSGLLVARPDLPPAQPSAILTEQLRIAKEKPDLKVFDDMADLFVADPIHDVDEPSGWPVVKQG